MLIKVSYIKKLYGFFSALEYFSAFFYKLQNISKISLDFYRF